MAKLTSQVPDNRHCEERSDEAIQVVVQVAQPSGLLRRPAGFSQ